MRKTITRIVLLAGWLVMLCAHAAHAGVLTLLKGGNPFLWFWTGIEALMKVLEAHPTATKAILGASLAAQLLGIIRGKTSGFPWTLFLLAVTLLAAVALVVLLKRR